MKIKLKQLVSSIDALKNLCNERIPLSVSFELGVLIEDSEHNLKIFDETRNNFIKKIGKEQKDGSYKIEDKDTPSVEKEMADLLNIEINLSIEPIKISTLGEIDIKPVDMHTLKWLFVK